ncbi:MAG: hypothetical protein ITG01_13210 [Comamonas sp.]|nr:hypothetical protein [Comamonas sp.]
MSTTAAIPAIDTFLPRDAWCVQAASVLRITARQWGVYGAWWPGPSGRNAANRAGRK